MSVVLLATLVFVQTEVLSLFSMINVVNVRIMWIAILMGAAVAAVVITKKRIVKFSCKLSQSDYLLIAVASAMSVWMIVLSIKTPLYNWDSMTYHMARVHEWFVSGTVNHYATGVVRQLTSPTFGEMLFLQVYAFCGANDVCVTLVQTVFYILSAILVFGLSQRMGLNKYLSFAAGFLFAATPIAFGEALTTQVDVISAFWLLAFCYLMLDFISPDTQLKFAPKGIISAITMSLCVGLAYLTKPSVCIGIAVFCVILIIKLIKCRDKITEVVKYALLSFPIAFLTVLPEALRNIRTFGSVSADIAGARQLVGTANPLYVFINFLKNISMNLPFRNEDIYFRGIRWSIKKIASLLNVPINDATIAEDGREYAILNPSTWNHDQAVNQIMIYSVLISFVLAAIAFFVTKKKADKLTKSYIIGALASFIIFNAVLRWEPFINRYMVGYYALLSPAVLLMLDYSFKTFKFKKTPKLCLYAIIIAVCLVSFANLSCKHFNVAVSCKTREEGYYYNNDYSLYSPLTAFCKEAGYETVGLCCGEDAYVYPFCHELYLNGQHVEYVGVSNESSKYEKEDFCPEAIVCIGGFIGDGSNVTRSVPLYRIDSDSDEIIYNDAVYRKVMGVEGYDNMCVYEQTSIGDGSNVTQSVPL